MIVCVCHRVSDRDIVKAVDAGTVCFKALQEQTQVATCCGCCHDCAREVFDAALTRAGAVGNAGTACTFAVQGMSLA